MNAENPRDSAQTERSNMYNSTRKIKFKLLLMEKGLTQIGIAHALGISECELSKVVNGHREPTDEVKGKLSKYLNTNAEYLFGNTDKDRKELYDDQSN